jgi:hypothetical protein
MFIFKLEVSEILSILSTLFEILGLVNLDNMSGFLRFLSFLLCLRGVLIVVLGRLRSFVDIKCYDSTHFNDFVTPTHFSNFEELVFLI